MSAPRTTSTLERNRFGFGGVVIADDTSEHIGLFHILYFPVATTIGSATLDSSYVAGSLDGKSYAANTKISVICTSITLTSGEAHCYKLSGFGGYRTIIAGGNYIADELGNLITDELGNQITD